MIRLSCTELPDRREALIDALMGGLDELLESAEDRPSVITVGEDWPALERLEIDLHDTRTRPEKLAHLRTPPGPTETELAVGFFEVRGEPLLHERAEVRFHLAAQAVRFGLGQAEEGDYRMTLLGAKEGHVRLAVSRESLESLILSAAEKQVRSLGVGLQSVHVELDSTGDRSLRASARIAVRKMFSADVDVKADLAVDDELDATITNVSIKAGGFLGQLLGGTLDQYAKRSEGRKISLAAFSMGNVRLRDVRIEVDDGIRIEASMGEA